MKTKHLTIMFTDVKGFTPRTSTISRQQLHKLLELHDKLIIPVFKEFNGRIVKTIGDSFMVSFNSPTDALLCGMKIQNVLDRHNEKSEDERVLDVRIAINSGEVTIKGNDVFGEAVNITSRLEGIADAGDIFFTESVYLAMNKSEIPTAEVGYRHFKGIPIEVKVYKVLREGKRKGFFSRERRVEYDFKSKKSRVRRIVKWVLVILAILFVIVLINGAKQKSEKEKMLQEENNVIRSLLETTARDVRNAINVGDGARARKGIDSLISTSERLNHPAELEKVINELNRLYKERFVVLKEKV
ncbi:hypothetical protein COV15_00820 [Candidatus Woesearchaeota archaeon CG10_big_fil_rev_8_21_14_0_10_34_12]|nr:MAG: hypothetical protein COV15_00820 [Candidatus Woesearchaeota archaeon CG10_big_fil_rev_8_21_14_0_10_34_12]